MNCEQVRDSISGFVDGSLSGILCQAISHHLKRCEGCSIILEQERMLVEQLTMSASIEVNEEFITRALKKACEQHEGKGFFFMPFRFVSAAACFFLGVFLTIVFQSTGFNLNSLLDTSSHAEGIELSVSDDEQLNIHLQVSVKNDMKDAMMVIEVPSSLQIVGFEDVNVLEWPVALKKGKNVLELPVKARQRFAEDQISHLIARLKTHRQQKDFDIKVTIKSSQNVRQEALLTYPEETQFNAGVSIISIDGHDVSKLRMLPSAV